MATPRGDGNFALSLVGAPINEKQNAEETNPLVAWAPLFTTRQRGT